MKYLFYFLLLIYPIILMLPQDINIGTYWGAAIVLLIILHHLYFFRLKGSKHQLNFFTKIGLALLFLSTISIVLNDLYTDSFYFWFALKYYIAFLIAGQFYDLFDLTRRSFKRLYSISLIFLIGFTVFITYRFSLFGFNIAAIASRREEIWLDKPVLLALMYASLFYLVTYFHYTQKKPKLLKYFFIWPLFIFGARSVLIGGLFSLLVFIINDYFPYFRKKIKVIIIFPILVALPFLGEIFSYVTGNESLMSVIGSSTTEKLGKTVNINNISSGRLDIIKNTIDNFSWTHIMQGQGRVNPKVQFITHNDFLDIFFIYGLVAFFIYVLFFYRQFIYALITRKYSNKSLENFCFALSIFIIIQSLFNPFLSTLSSIYYFLLIVILYKHWIMLRKQLT